MQSDLIGRKLGPFEIVQYNGSDGLAELFLGFDPRVDQPVEIKIVGRDLSPDPVFNARFRREAKSIAGLRHPNIGELIDFGQAEGGHYMVTEHVEGLSLAELIVQLHQGERTLEPDDITFWVRQTAAALDLAHRHGVAHGSLAPQYILLTRSGQAIVTDFGIGLLHSRAADASGDAIMLPATPYMSPEQIADFRATSPASDIYALGVILYQLMTGELPFDTASDIDEVLRSLNETAPDPRFLNPDVPPAVALVILKALSYSPGERFRSAMRLADALERAYANPDAGEEILDPASARKEKAGPEDGARRGAASGAALPGMRRPITPEERREKKRIHDELDRIKKAEEDEKRRIKQAQDAEKRRIRQAELAVKRKAFRAKWGRTILVTSIVVLLLVALLVVLQTVGVISIAVKLPAVRLPGFAFGGRGTEEAAVVPTATQTLRPTQTVTPYPTPTTRPTATALAPAGGTPLPPLEFVPLGAGSLAFRIPDGQAMVHVPAGPFLMGANARDRGENSRPQHTVTLSAYWIDRTEISNSQYRLCVEAGLCPLPTNLIRYDNPIYADYPAVHVTYQHAVSYCFYAASQTGQVIGLPTEAQWEKAAGWDPAAEAQRLYPWGDETPSPDRMRYIESPDPRPASPVGSHPAGASAYGALDMGGNVWEWAADWYDVDQYKRTGVSLDPIGPLTGTYRVTRGGSWTREARFAITTARNPVLPHQSSDEIGFRCAMSVDRPPAGSGILLTPIDLVRSFLALLDEAAADTANDDATLGEWRTALERIEQELVAVDNASAGQLIGERLERLDTQTRNGLLSPSLSLRLEQGLRWVLDQIGPAEVVP